MRTHIHIQKDIPSVELDSIVFWKFRTQSEVEDFLTSNKIEDRTNMNGDVPLYKTLWEAGDVYYGYYEPEDINALVVADDETELNWAIKYDYDEQTYYVSDQPASFGNNYDSTIIYLTESHGDEPIEL